MGFVVLYIQVVDDEVRVRAVSLGTGDPLYKLAAWFGERPDGWGIDEQDEGFCVSQRGAPATFDITPVAVHIGSVHDAPGAPREDIAHAVDGDGQAGVPAPSDEQIPRLAVKIGQRQAADTALGRGADLRHRHQAVPQAFAVNLDRRV